MNSDQLQPISSPTAVKIVDAAGHLFLQKGYKAVSISDIIRAAEVTKPTLYYYFADKEELFVQMGLRVLAEMGERLRHAAATPGDTTARLRALAAVLMANRDTDMRMLRHEMFEHLSNSNRERLATAFFGQLVAPIVGVMERGLADGELAHHSASTLAQMFISIAEAFQEFAPAATANWSDTIDPLFGSPTLNVEVLINLFLHGVAA